MLSEQRSFWEKDVPIPVAFILCGSTFWAGWRYVLSLPFSPFSDACLELPGLTDVSHAVVIQSLCKSMPTVSRCCRPCCSILHAPSELSQKH
eukprot:3713243-Rhodomonas_salina.3